MNGWHEVNPEPKEESITVGMKSTVMYENNNIKPNLHDNQGN